MVLVQLVEFAGSATEESQVQLHFDRFCLWTLRLDQVGGQTSVALVTRLGLLHEHSALKLDNLLEPKVITLLEWAGRRVPLATMLPVVPVRRVNRCRPFG
jgi:hypothetical protein